MISLEISVSPYLGKHVEFDQSVAYFQKNLNGNFSQFNVVVANNNDYKLSFNLETENETKELLSSNSFTLLSGAIQTLSNSYLLSLKDGKSKKIFSCKDLSKIKNYLNTKEKENA